MDPVARDYDALSAAYAAHVGGELAHKPMDRAWLDALARYVGGLGLLGDIGCGPGHVTAHLAASGADVLGLDLSPGMIAVARAAYPVLGFEVADKRALGVRPGRFTGLLAMYSLIHFAPDTLAEALAACHAALVPGGHFAAAVHLGEGVLHPGQLWEVPISLGFRLFAEGELDAALQVAGFHVTESRVREPYPEVEYPSRRAYLRAMA